MSSFLTKKDNGAWKALAAREPGLAKLVCWHFPVALTSGRKGEVGVRPVRVPAVRWEY